MNHVIFNKTKVDKVFDYHLLDQLGVPIRNLVVDSRQVQPGDTFLAYAGEKEDARKFIPQAIAAGANAILWDPKRFSWNPDWKLPALAIPELRSRAGLIASHVYGNPSHKLWLVGITGTNGKTSCSHWYAQAMTALHRKTGLMGTLGTGFCDELIPSVNTTPDAILLQKTLAGFVQQGASHGVMEVSSHGIAQERINGTVFSVAVLTNLSRDHLDYHEDMDAYAAEKARLFSWPGLKYAILNLDDVLGVELSRQLTSRPVQMIGYGFSQPRMSGYSKYLKIVYGTNLKANTDGLEFDIEFEDDREKLKVDLLGRFNASNLLAVIAMLLVSGIRLSDAVQSLRYIRPIPGRMQKFGGMHQPVVIVDYAHTPDALEKVLITLREMLRTAGQGKPLIAPAARLYCIVGCGGDRDKGKRPMVGEVATRLADEVIFTSDNPRSEEPRAIIENIVTGAKATNYQIEINRALAIYQAIHCADVGDIVLVAGKGHETYQEIKGQKIPFDDMEVVRQVLQDWGADKWVQV